MRDTTNPKFIMQYAVREEQLSPILHRTSFESESRQGEMRLFEVYPGVQVWSIDFHMERLDIQPLESYGRAWSVEELAMRLQTTTDDIK